MINETTGKLSIWLTEGPVEKTALEVCCGLTEGGERLLVLDAARCFDPSRLSRASSSAARNMEVIHISSGGAGGDIESAISANLLAARQHNAVHRLMLVGILDHLYDRQMLTRDTARALGRIKLFLGTLAASGVEVMVLCQAPTGLGARTYVISSLCASADEVLRPASDAQQDVNSAAAAIA